MGSAGKTSGQLASAAARFLSNHTHEGRAKMAAIDNCLHCEHPFRPQRSTARFCGGRCRLAFHRAGRRPGRHHNAFLSVSGDLATPDTGFPFETLKTQQPCESKQPSWRWYDRLDGSSDLYCDTETTTAHVARIVRRDGSFHLAKPALPMSWQIVVRRSAALG